MRIELSVIAPFFNEEENVYEFYTRLKTVLLKLNLTHEVILVDDGSSDKTLQILEKIAANDDHVKFISLSRNFGHQAALYAGLENCKGDKIVLIDSDLQDPPEVIEVLWCKMIEGFDIVHARRRVRRGEPLLKKSTANLFYRILSRITSINIPIDTGDFRIVDRRVLTELLRMKDQTKFLRGQFAWLGFRESSIDYEREKRRNGKTNFGYLKMLRFALDGITGFSNAPLKFASFSGIIVSIFAFASIVYVLYAKLVLGKVISGWTSIMVTVLFLGGIQLLSLGIIGEYISRINESVKNRQPYIIVKTNIDHNQEVK